MIKFLLPGAVIVSLVFVVIGYILSQRQPIPVSVEQEDTITSPAETVASSITQDVVIPAPLTSQASDSAILTRVNELSKQIAGLVGMNTKVDNLEKQIDDLSTRLAKLENPQSFSITSPSPGASVASSNGLVKGPMYLYALGYGGSTTQTDWSEIPTLNIAYDPAWYPGYKSLQLEVQLRVRDGNGKAFARLYASGTPATASEVTSANYQDEWVSGGTFTWNSKSTFTIQLKSLTGYDAYVSNARLKINF